MCGVAIAEGEEDVTSADYERDEVEIFDMQSKATELKKRLKKAEKAVSKAAEKHKSQVCQSLCI